MGKEQGGGGGVNGIFRNKEIKKKEKENTKVSHVISGFHLSSKQEKKGGEMYSSIW